MVPEGFGFSLCPYVNFDGFYYYQRHLDWCDPGCFQRLVGVNCASNFQSDLLLVIHYCLCRSFGDWYLHDDHASEMGALVSLIKDLTNYSPLKILGAS